MSNVQPPITLCFWYIYINQVYVNNFSAIRSKRVDRSRKERVENHSIEADNSLAACYIVSLQYIRKLEKVDEWLESVDILPHSNRRATVGCVVWTVVVVTSVEAGGGGGRCGGGQPGASQLSVPRMVQRSPSPLACSRQQPSSPARGWCWATVLLLAAAPATLASKLEFKHHNNTELAAILQQVT